MSFYDNKPLHLDENVIQQLNHMINFLMMSSLSLLSEHVTLDSGFYICNIITGECTCLEYIWNGSLRDKCRHCHAAILFKDMQQKGCEKVVIETKKELVQYFRNKERVIPASKKNDIIYQDNVENSYQEIIKLYNIQGNI
jgi:hypothetical protein